MSCQHGAIVHFVNMVAGQDQHVLGFMAANNVEILQYRIRSALIPGGFNALLGGKQFHKLVKLTTHEAPPPLDMANQGMGLVLGNDPHLGNAGVNTVRQRKINNPEFSAEGHRRFGAPLGEIMEPGTTPARKNQSESLPCKTADEALRSMHDTFPENLGGLLSLFEQMKGESTSI